MLLHQLTLQRCIVLALVAGIDYSYEPLQGMAQKQAANKPQKLKLDDESDDE
jgi:hypothetical protein